MITNLKPTYRTQKYVGENGNLTNTKTIFRVKKYGDRRNQF
jgi:hypothetical protein